MNEGEILDSWKAIASFLRRGIRTVQRWEKTERLPVRRHHHMKRGSIYALRSELEGWQRTRELRGAQLKSVPNLQEFHRLHMLTQQQVVLASELKSLLQNVNFQTEGDRLKPSGIATTSLPSTRANPA